MNLYIFSEDFGSKFGEYEFFVMAENEDDAINLFIAQYEKDYYITLKKEEIKKPKEIYTTPVCVIRYFE